MTALTELLAALREAEALVAKLDQDGFWIENCFYPYDPVACELNIRFARLSALADKAERETQWQPTHRHYKGSLYRVIGQGIHTESVEPLTFYENKVGNLFVRPTAMFNDEIDSGRLRFVALDAADTGKKETQGG